MKVLFVTPQLPWPPTQGTALRNYHLLAAAAHEHVVDLLTFGAEPAPNALTSLCGRIEIVPFPPRSAVARVRDLALGWADMERRLWSPDFARRLEHLLSAGGYDVVQLEGFEVAGYLLGPEALRREAHDFARRLPKLIFDDHNAEYELQASAARIDARRPGRWPRAAYSTVQARRLRRREALYACAADASLVVSAEDGAALERIAPGVGAVVVPNGVDCAAPVRRDPAPQPTVLFSGKLDYRPNVDACDWLVAEVLPRVRSSIPDVRVVLAGRDPTPAVRALAGPGVEVTGALDEADLAARRAHAWVYAVPMRMGSGVRFKVLEAMAAHVPLVSTSLGVSGTGAVHGTHALVRDDADGFARALVEVLTERERADALASAARRLAEEVHDWSHIRPRLLAVYETLSAPPTSRASVIATVKNERESAGRLLRSLAGQTRAPDEVVIVDGGSTDGTPDVMRAVGGDLAPRVIEAPGANISVGRNLAIDAASRDLIMATDAGVELHPAWCERMTVALAPAGRDVQAASGFFVSAPQSAWELALGATTLPDVGDVEPAHFLPSSRSIAFTKEAWQAAGGYPEWLDYCEDLLFDFGLIHAGARPRFVPRATVRFRPRASVRAFFLQYFRYARGDGKADLWRRRHAIRYATYLAALALTQRALRGDAWALGLLAAGGAAYLRRPLARLSEQANDPLELLRAAPLVAVARLVGDVAKMIGYPVGVLWRVRRRFSRS